MLQRILPLDPGDPSEPSYERKRRVYERGFDGYHERIAAEKNAINLDWLTEMYEHPTWDDFWKRRSFATRLNEIDTPTLHGGVWWDHFGRGTIRSHVGVDVPKRAVHGTWRARR